MVNDEGLPVAEAGSSGVWNWPGFDAEGGYPGGER